VTETHDPFWQRFLHGFVVVMVILFGSAMFAAALDFDGATGAIVGAGSGLVIGFTIASVQAYRERRDRP
jgi:hypothetical protein